jgi:hypothetical protein
MFAKQSEHRFTFFVSFAFEFCILRPALSPSLSDKKSLLQKICGLNLSLQNRKVVFTPQNQWASLCDAHKKISEMPLCLVLVEMPGV